MLSLEKVNAYYGLSHVLHDVCLEVGDGETVCLLGRNGAGKTTTLNTIMGVVKQRSGKIVFKGNNLSIMRPFEILHAGVGLVPEDRGIFPGLTLLENLRMGHMAGRKGWSFEEYCQYVFSLFPRLKDRIKNPGKKLSGGEQQMLAIARALGSRPSLLMIDEPTEGLAPEYVERIRQTIWALQQRKVGILLVESNVKLALGVSQRVYFIEKGIIRYTNSAEEVLKEPEIRLRYLGVT